MRSPAEYETCAFCPRLCRHVCPVAVGSAREAATPTNMMTGPWMHSQDMLVALDAGAMAALCVSCGACEAHCRLHRPVSDLLAHARAELLPPANPSQPEAVSGAGDLIAVECDGRAWASAAAATLGEPVAVLRTSDHLGEALLDHPTLFEAHARRLAERVGDRTLLVADHGCLRAALTAGLRVRHLAELLPVGGDAPTFHPCQGPRLDGASAPDALACCGATAPLSVWHPEIAAEVGAAAAARLGALEVRCPDARCASTLRAAGARVTDPVTALLQSDTSPT